MKCKIPSLHIGDKEYNMNTIDDACSHPGHYQDSWNVIIKVRKTTETRQMHIDFPAYA